MARRTRPQYRLRPRQRPAPRGERIRLTPFFWLVTGGATLIVVAGLGLGGWWLSRRPDAAPTPPAPATAGSALGDTAVIPVTDAPPPTPTPVPRACRARVGTRAHAEPKGQTITEPVSAGTPLLVFEAVDEDGRRWYRVNLGGQERFVPVEDVDCGETP